MGVHTRVYAGVGSRRAPPEVLQLIEAIAGARAREGWTLRTGGSPGCDQAFLRGALAARGAVELYLPWRGFARAAWRGGAAVAVSPQPSPLAHALAAELHPRWEELPAREHALLARDCEEVLGADLSAPAAELLCWTADGSLDGAGLFEDRTGQALRVARRAGVPVINLARPEGERRMRRSLVRRG